MEKETDALQTPTEDLPEIAPLESFEYEEFDISTFDFTIHDPGEDPQPESNPAPEAMPDPEPESPSQPERRIQKPKPEKRPRAPKEASPRPETIRKPLTRQQLRSKSKRYLRYALRPTGLYENISEAYWPVFLLGACLFGGGLYLLAGMDWFRAGLISFGRMWAFVLAGLLVGGLATLVFAGCAALLARFCKMDDLRPFRLISATAGAAVFPACVLIVGLLTGLIFGVSVFISFGILALLWWIFFLMEVLRDLFAERNAATLTLMILWGLGLFTLISLTFSMK